MYLTAYTAHNTATVVRICDNSTKRGDGAMQNVVKRRHGLPARSSTLQAWVTHSSITLTTFRQLVSKLCI